MREDRLAPSGKLLLTCIVCMFVVAPIVGYGLAALTQKNNNSLTTTPPVRSQNDYYTLLKNSSKNLRDETGKPTFTIYSVDKINNNWYIVWIDDGMKTLVNDSYNDPAGMAVILGPGTSFSQSEVSNKKVPQVIYQEFIDAKK